MDHREPTSALAVPSTDRLAALRRHQRRLVFGGGGLLTLLILLGASGGAPSVIKDFHAKHAELFREERDALDFSLSYRERAFTNGAIRNNTLWVTHRHSLIENGIPLTETFHAQGEQLVIQAEGKISVPWLVLGQGTVAMAKESLAAYLGMIRLYSAYVPTVITPTEFSGSVMIYGYDSTDSLFAFTSVRDEAQLLQMLKVTSRAQAFAKLRAEEARWQGATQPRAGATSSIGDEETIFYYGINPLNQRPSLVGTLTLAIDGKPYFRRVIFEPIDDLRTRFTGNLSGAFAIVTPSGERVLEIGVLPDTAQESLASLRVPAGGVGLLRLRRGGNFFLVGRLQHVDWNLVHVYSWRDLFASEKRDIATIAGASLLMLFVLWALLLQLDRRVFGPALADASRVYESEALSRTIIETSPVGLCLLDPESGKPIVENDIARDMASEDGANTMAALYVRLTEHAKANLPERLQEFQWAERVAGKRQRSLQVAMALSSYRDDPVWVCVLRDVTAQAELEENLHRARHDSEQARLAAESASRAKTAFVATMSHEIRTPLNGVLGHLELLSRSRLDVAQRERLDRIRLSADALLAIISDVLDFSKIEAGQLDIELVSFALRPLVEQAVLLYAPGAQRKGVQLYYSIDSTLAESYVSDVHRIRQIIHNLLSNAVKFTETGRIVLSVAPGEAATGHPKQLRFRIVDSGIGMSAAQLGQLFEPFLQADASISRRYGGSGLGLALCRQLARLLGGQVLAESTQGVGSVFTLDIPVTPAEEKESATPLAGRRITLLSAAAEWRTEIGDLLKSWGAFVTVISQPAELRDEAGRGLLLIFGEARSWTPKDEGRLVATHERVIRAYGDGPLTPEARRNEVFVSCYTSQTLLSAIQDVPIVLESPSPLPQAARGSRGAILLAEDNPVNRELIQQQLEELGFRVDTAEDGAVALRKWWPDTYIAVLTDISMPTMNGYELAMALRERDTSVPILAITATALASERTRCKEAGIDDLLLKPLTLERLDEALGRYAPAMLRAASPVKSVSDVQDRADVPKQRMFSEKVRRAFVESGRRDLGIVSSALEHGDIKTLVDSVHAFKGVLLMLGETRVAEECSALEALLVERGGADLRGEDVQHLTATLDAVLRRYEDELGH